MADLFQRIHANFRRQRVMALFGAELKTVQEGLAEIELAYREDLTQQHGYLHAAVTTAIADSACGYAALSRMPEGSDVVSVEFKVNLLSPARGERFVARGEVVRAGRTLVVTRGEVMAWHGEEAQTVLLIQATMMRVTG
jgi:uncharacterized protein (TIGR00369 family)